MSNATVTPRFGVLNLALTACSQPLSRADGLSINIRIRALSIQLTSVTRFVVAIQYVSWELGPSTNPRKIGQRGFCFHLSNANEGNTTLMARDLHFVNTPCLVKSTYQQSTTPAVTVSSTLSWAGRQRHASILYIPRSVSKLFPASLDAKDGDAFRRDPLF